KYIIGTKLVLGHNTTSEACARLRVKLHDVVALLCIYVHDATCSQLTELRDVDRVIWLEVLPTDGKD
ncbi:hypothetical protein HAX54_011533, partial [Datura stramonium]|nr:hypothetical protein [Datura stramonium]